MQVSSEELKSSGEIHYIKQYQISVIPTPYLEQMSLSQTCTLLHFYLYY